MAICKLCSKDKELVESHIIPKFIFKWMKETGTEFLRAGRSPNLRNQDGIKEYLLCNECEQLLGKSEKWFAENIFNPYLKNNQVVFIYEDLLSKFSVSLLWRILLTSDIREQNNKSRFEKKINEAFIEWKLFLFEGKIPRVYNEIHLLFIPDEWGASQPHRYISRYFGRDIDGNIIEIDDKCWIYVKFARFMIFGRISSNKSPFRNSKINFKNGITSLTQYIDDPELKNYLIARAEFVYEYFKSQISDKQLNTIQKSTERRIDIIKSSDLGRRLKQDYTATINTDSFINSFNYLCDCCENEISEPEGYLLRTFEIILSKKYFSNFFKKNGLDRSKEHLEIRLEMFKHISSQNKPWVVCEKCNNQFEFNKEQAKNFMNKWIKNKGDYAPPKSRNFRKHLTKEQIKQIEHTIVTV